MADKEHQGIKGHCLNENCDWWDLAEIRVHDDGTMTHRCPRCNVPMWVEEDKISNERFLKTGKHF